MKEKPTDIHPAILSISRRTDIPGFHGEWLCRIMEKGEVSVPNPYSGKRRLVSFASTLAAVLWTKNPEPFLPLLGRFSSLLPRFYFQYTLNDYSGTALEHRLPPLVRRVETFRRLSGQVGAGRVVWRFDPLCLAFGLEPGRLLERIASLAGQLSGFTDELVFSFYKPGEYSRVDRNMERADVSVRAFTGEEMLETATAIVGIARANGMRASTCCETADLSGSGVKASRCIDDRRFAALYPGYRELMLHLGRVAGPGRLFPESEEDVYRKLRDRGQRRGCGCIRAVDIGTYNSCPHGCLYCYANRSPDGPEFPCP